MTGLNMRETFEEFVKKEMPSDIESRFLINAEKMKTDILIYSMQEYTWTYQAEKIDQLLEANRKLNIEIVSRLNPDIIRLLEENEKLKETIENQKDIIKNNKIAMYKFIDDMEEIIKMD